LETLDDFLPILAVLIAVIPLWLDIRKLQSDIPSKRLENLSKSFGLLQQDNDFLRERETNYLDYIDYIWVWIESTAKKYKIKGSQMPKVFSDFVQRRKP